MCLATGSLQDRASVQLRLCLDSSRVRVGTELWASAWERRACTESESGPAQRWLVQERIASCNKTASTLQLGAGIYLFSDSGLCQIL